MRNFSGNATVGDGISSLEVTRVTLFPGISSMISPAISMPTGPPPTIRMFWAAARSALACLNTAVASALVEALLPTPTSVPRKRREWAMGGGGGVIASLFPSGQFTIMVYDGSSNEFSEEGSMGHHSALSR